MPCHCHPHPLCIHEPPYEQLLIGVGWVHSLSPLSHLPGPLSVIPFSCCLYHLAAGWWYCPLALFLHLLVVPAPCMHPVSSCSQLWWGVLGNFWVCRAGGGCCIVGSISAHSGLWCGCFAPAVVAVVPCGYVVSVMWQVLRDQVHTLQVPHFTGLLAPPWCRFHEFVIIPLSTLQGVACSSGSGVRTVVGQEVCFSG